MKTPMIRKLVQKVVDLFGKGINSRGWCHAPPGFLKGLRATLLWIGWGLVIFVVLAELFLGRYRVIGPWVLGIAGFLSGMLLGRWLVHNNYGLGKQVAVSEVASLEPHPMNGITPPNSGDPAAIRKNFWIAAVVGIIFSLIAIKALMLPRQLNVPENATLAWTIPPGQELPSEPYIWWVRIRQQQCEFAPVLLFMGGLSIAIYWFADRRSRRNPPDADQHPSPAKTVAAAFAGPHPVLVAIVYYVLFLVVAFCISFSE